MLKKSLTTELLLKVPFFDVDSMRCVWHGNYVKYFELARCQLLDIIDFGYSKMESAGHGWPVIDIRVKYIKPALFDHTLRICAELTEYENRIKIHYVIYDNDSGERLTKGYSVQVAVAIDSGEMCYTSPDILLERLTCYGYL